MFKEKRLLLKISSIFIFIFILLLSNLILNNNNHITTFAAENNNGRQMEYLDRGLIATVSPRGGVYLSWRLLGTESKNLGFNIYRDGIKINSQPIIDKTNYDDSEGNVDSIYKIRAVSNGVEIDESTPIGNKVLPLYSGSGTNPSDKKAAKLELILDQPPSGITPTGEEYTYAPGDCSVGDLDGDGQYEIITKWDPSNAKDNSQGGYTGNVIIDAYKLDGTKLWRIDLGKNIRAGAHYTQLMVYDLDGDGKAEVACKTADGTKDGIGQYIGDKNADYRNSSGYILSGPEYLTVFRGSDGKVLTTINYTPARGTVSSWGDSYGNRVDRFLACIAYLDGKTPSLVMCRGYYTRAVLAAYKFENNTLTEQWVFDSSTAGNEGYSGQGNHNLSVADVDNDGFDEIIYGSATIDNDGKGLYTTKLGHGDAIHVGDFIPSRDGLEVMSPHESGDFGFSVRDAKTGEVIIRVNSTGDTGRGMAGDISPDYPGAEFWAAGCGLWANINGKYTKVEGASVPTMSFLTWWDGDLYRETFESDRLDKFNVGRLFTAWEDAHSINGTKGTPALQADLFGDWREEIILATRQGAEIPKLVIYTTTIPTEYKIPTLMHDSVYRLGVAWQNIAYNQPPHTSFYLSDETVNNIDLANIYYPNTEGLMRENPKVDSYYKIKNVKTGKYLSVTNEADLSGTNVQQWQKIDSTSQIWKVVDGGDGYIQLASQVGTGLKMLDVSAKDSNVQISDYTKGDSEKFKVILNGDGTSRILTKSSNEVKGLDVLGGRSANGTNVLEYTYKAGTNQKWIFEKVDYVAPIVDGVVYYIKNANSKKYIHVSEAKDANGANIDQFDQYFGPSQKFKAVATSDGYFKFVSQVGSATRVLDVSGNKADNGTNIIIYNDKSGKNQQFKMIHIEDDRYAMLSRASNDIGCVAVSGGSNKNAANIVQWKYSGVMSQQWIFEIVRE